MIQVNDAKAPAEIAAPYSIGKWQQAPPLELTLGTGKTVIHFTPADENHNVSIKDFTRTPAK